MCMDTSMAHVYATLFYGTGMLDIGYIYGTGMLDKFTAQVCWMYLRHRYVGYRIYLRHRFVGSASVAESRLLVQVP